jgi:tRNA (cytidine/uridine-2'-O-)-methyltransferase
MSKNFFNLVLIRPEIPQNTGGIGRLCVSTECKLHLVKPLGFSLEDKFLKRAGMDYWPHLELDIYENFADFLDRNPGAAMHFFSTKGVRSLWDVEFKTGDYLVFGNESSGFPKEFYDLYRERLVTIPMNGRFHRSLNLANSSAIALYEAIRQNRHEWEANHA